MPLIDITLPLQNGLVVWPGDRPVQIERRRFVERDKANVSDLCLSLHTGTHVDPPLHFIAGGASVDQFALDDLVGPADVADFSDLDVITAADLEAKGLPADCRRLLLRTRNSRWWAAGDAKTFHTDYVGISADAAQWAIDRGIRLLGIDYLSVDPYDVAGHPAHYALLGASVIILETINLSEAAAGRYQLYCLPLLVSGGDGAPARALLQTL